MMFLHTLRLAGDLGFYYAFAGFFAASFGGTPMPLVLVWPALCFGLASCFEGSRPLRTTLAALSAAALLFLPTGADKLCYFPAAVYPVLLAYTGDFALSPVRQAERLRWLCRVWPFFAVAMLLWNANAVLSAALPFATAAAVLLVGFNRTTRQDPEISTRPGYLLLSGGVLAAVCAGPFLLSRSVVVAGAKAAASAVYFGGIVPVLQLFLNNIVVQGVTWLFHGILQFIHWLFTLFPPKPLERTEIVSTDEVIANAQKAAEDAEPLINGMSMLTALGILLAVLCAVLVVRHFLRQKFRHTNTACTDTTVRRSTHKRARRWPGLFLSPVDKVRREYAIYLDHCQRHGVTILRGDTSLDLTGRAFGMDFAAEAELRQIYLKARYNGTATAEDAARAAEPVLTPADSGAVGVQLTLSREIQQTAEAVANETMQSGCILVLDTANAKVRACVSRPGYDPENISASLNAPDSPLLERAFQCYAVGSVFKPVVAAAALEAGESGFVYTCPGWCAVDGRIFRCAGGIPHGEVDLAGALEKSCNGYFIRLGQALGADAVRAMAEQLGFGQAIPLTDALYTAAGVLPEREALASSGAYANFCFGQGELLASPLQVAAMMNTIACGGICRTPLLLETTLDETTGAPLTALSHVRSRRVLTKRTAAALQALLAGVVAGGTGHEAALPGQTAAGKTGTAQTGQFSGGTELKNYWFAGFVPAEQPRYTIVVLQDTQAEPAFSSAAIFARVAAGLEILAP